MSFTSLLFIFIFLPAVLVLFYLLPRGNWRRAVLVFSSLAFFAWADLRHLLLLVGFVLLHYGFGLLIGRFQRKEQVGWAKTMMWVGVMGSLVFILLYKYLGFFGGILNQISKGQIEVTTLASFFGISYLTFSGMSYLLDVHREARAPEKNILNFSAYLLMFPKLIQGPILLFKDYQSDVGETKFDSDGFAGGIRRFILGLGKKVLLADFLIVAANRVFSSSSEQLGASAAWVGLLAYSLVIYFDFSGYTDMALGIGALFGVKLPENFNFPYLSRSISDFWRRWHITLNNWFRTYVFMPLEYKRRRVKFYRVQTHILIVFLLTGFWHGASWNFILWGLYFGILLAVEASGWGRRLKKAPVFLQHGYAIFLILVGWVFFRVREIQNWGPFVGALIGLNGWVGENSLRSMNILLYLPTLLVGGVLSTPVLVKINQWVEEKQGVPRIILDLLLLCLFVLSIAFILSNDFKPFLYAQF
jgi:alginate O-acetyltransferase complex protein AlgI